MSKEKRTVLQREIDSKMIYNEVLADMVNGTAVADCIRKLELGLYETPHYKDNGISKSHAYKIIRKALDESKTEIHQEREALRSMTYNRLLAIYEDSIKNCDRSNAIKALDSMSKLLGLNQVENQNNIQIVNNKEGINITFGFNNKDED